MPMSTTAGYAQVVDMGTSEKVTVLEIREVVFTHLSGGS
jgi:hypothetical protein